MMIQRESNPLPKPELRSGRRRRWSIIYSFAILFLLANRAKYFSTWAGRRWRRVCSSTRLKGTFY